MTISYEEAQELHLLVGGPLEASENHEGSAVLVRLVDLERAREIVALIISDMEEPETMEPPC